MSFEPSLARLLAQMPLMMLVQVEREVSSMIDAIYTDDDLKYERHHHRYTRVNRAARRALAQRQMLASLET